MIVTNSNFLHSRDSNRHRDIASVGDHFIIGLRPTSSLHDLDRALLAELRPPGVALYKDNFRHDLPYDKWLLELDRLIGDVRSALRRDRILVAIDHEGGRVCRTPLPITRFPAAAYWGERSAAIGTCMGRELASIGVNLNFAPVLDIQSNRRNTVIGERAFGVTARKVSQAAIPFMESMQSQKVLACGKHFPGNGDTGIDPHWGLPSVEIDLEGLRARELKPFAAAIRANIPMIMTSHVLFPQIDGGTPVTLSHLFATRILRDDLGFRGVVVSDDIGMHAMDRFFGDPAAAAQFMIAGGDMLMICSYWTDTDRARSFASAIINALESGQLHRNTVESARQRIANLLGRAAQNCVTQLPSEIFREHSNVGTLNAT